jgi:hypothetical protein
MLPSKPNRKTDMKPSTIRQITAALLAASGVGLMFVTDLLPVALQMLAYVATIALMMAAVYLFINPAGKTRLVAVIAAIAGVGTLGALTGLTMSGFRPVAELAHVGYAFLAVSAATLVFAGIAGTIAEERAQKAAEEKPSEAAE